MYAPVPDHDNQSRTKEPSSYGSTAAAAACFVLMLGLLVTLLLQGWQGRKAVEHVREVLVLQRSFSIRIAKVTNPDNFYLKEPGLPVYHVSIGSPGWVGAHDNFPEELLAILENDRTVQYGSVVLLSGDATSAEPQSKRSKRHSMQGRNATFPAIRGLAIEHGEETCTVNILLEENDPTIVMPESVKGLIAKMAARLDLEMQPLAGEDWIVDGDLRRFHANARLIRRPLVIKLND